MSNVLVMILTPLLWFGGWIVLIVGTIKMDRKHPNEWKSFIPIPIGVLMMVVSLYLASTKGWCVLK